MTPWVSYAITIAAATAGALVVPWVGMRMLVSTIEASGVATTNYRGRRVVYGLGLVWVFWVVGVQLAGALLELAANRFWADWQFVPDASNFAYIAQPVLVLGVMALGLADDTFGTAGERGFRGHVAALRSGRLTTGGLKLLGVGLLAAAVTLPRAVIAPATVAPMTTAGIWVLQTLAIALTANLVNLTDLRPGRACKVYSAMVVALALVPALWGASVTAGTVLVLALGPVIAVWRFDLGERAMLGDAGANAAGALLGWLAVVVLSTTWMLALYVAFMLALNLISEKVSFTRVIAGNRVLSWLDGLGRLPNSDAETESGEKSSSESDGTEK